MSRLLRPTTLTLVVSLVLAACASTPPPPPPPPGGSGGPVALRDWRGIVTAGDRDRYSRREAAWSLALHQARRQPGSGALTGPGDLLDPRAARPSVSVPFTPPTPPPKSNAVLLAGHRVRQTTRITE